MQSSETFSAPASAPVPRCKRTVAPKALDRFKRRIREITRQVEGGQYQDDDRRASFLYGGAGALLRLLRLRCWSVYHLVGRGCDCEPIATVENLPSSAARRLIASGSAPRLGRRYTSRQRSWSVVLARSEALSVGLSNAYFQSLGLPSLVEDC